MPIYRNDQPFLYVFCGKQEEWDNLIAKTCSTKKEVYLFDHIKEPKEYPKNLIIVRSVKTAKRLFHTMPWSNSALFVNLQRFGRKAHKVSVPAQSNATLIGFIDLHTLQTFLKHETVHKEASKSVKFLHKYQ